MKIQIRSESCNLTLWFPSLLIFNDVTATLAGRRIISKLTDNDNIKISPKACRKIFRCINRCRRKNKNWYAVDVCSSDGDEVLIKL